MSYAAVLVAAEPMPLSAWRVDWQNHVAIGPCIRCGHMTVQHWNTVTLHGEVTHDQRLVPVTCQCDFHHPETPPGRSGCGASWMMRVDDKRRSIETATEHLDFASAQEELTRSEQAEPIAYLVADERRRLSRSLEVSTWLTYFVMLLSVAGVVVTALAAAEWQFALNGAAFNVLLAASTGLVASIVVRVSESRRRKRDPRPISRATLSSLPYEGMIEDFDNLQKEFDRLTSSESKRG